MQDPILKFQKYDSQTETMIDICEMRLQYFSPEQTFDLWEHKPNKRGDHLYFKIGEKNEREDRNKVLFGERGYVYSFAKVYAHSVKNHVNDHLIVSFSGYGDCTGSTIILDIAQYNNLLTKKHKPVIDDFDLLMKKYNEINVT